VQSDAETMTEFRVGLECLLIVAPAKNCVPVKSAHSPALRSDNKRLFGILVCRIKRRNTLDIFRITKAR